MATKISFHHFLVSIFVFSICVQGITDPTDVQALQVLYKSLNKAAQLTNWETCDGDPCTESWRGVTCQGTSVVSIQLPGLGLDGKLGYLLSGFHSLKTLDLSRNKIHDTIPYELPPNLTSMNFANNNLSGTLPYSIATMFKLKYVNLSGNMLSQNIGDIFTNLTSLATLDLSHNNFTGDLPNSISSLSKLSTLNIANNNFTGSIPRGLLSLPTFRYDGNSFVNSPAPPLPPYTPPLPAGPNNNRSPSPPSLVSAGYGGQSSNTSNPKKLSTGAIIGICVGSTFSVNLGLQLLAFTLQQMKMKKIVGNTSKGNQPMTKAKVFSSNPTFPDNQEKIENFHSIPEKSVAQPSRSRSLVDEDEDEENGLTLVDETSTGVVEREEEQREEEKKEGEEMTGKNFDKTTTTLSKKLKNALVGRMRKILKRNPPTSGSGVKKTKTNLLKESSSGIDSHPVVVDLTGATSQVKTDGVSQTSTQSKKNKGKTIEEGPETASESLNIELPADFMKSDVLEKEGMFPLMNNFLLPHNMERYKDAPIEDVNAHAVELSFMAFQTSLALHAKMEKVKEIEVEGRAKKELKGRPKESLDKVFASKAEVKSSLAENEKETKTLNSALVEPKERVSKIEDQPAAFDEEKVEDLTGDEAIPTENVVAEEAVDGTHPSS